MSGQRRPRLIVCITAAVALGSAAPSPAAQLDLVVNGRGTIDATIADAKAGERAEARCTSVDLEKRAECRVDYVSGRVVTLRAEPVVGAGPSSFEFWSDDRCPSGPVCQIALDSALQAVAASFSPQLVMVRMSTAPQPGRVASTPLGLACEAMLDVERVCSGEFPLLTPVDLIAEGAGAQWRPSGWGPEEDYCDSVVGATCSVSAHSYRHVGLLFPGGLLSAAGPGGVGLQFRVAKKGTGSGTVRSRSIDCGDICSDSLAFGDRQTLVADPASGSRFMGWRGACAESPRCSLVVGPVTRITAVFDAVAAPSNQGASKSPTRRRSTSARRSGRRFVAVVGRRVVVRGVRPRRVVFTVRVNSPASIRAVLTRPRGHRVAARTWKVRRGRRVLKLSVPRRARRATYVLRVNASNDRGEVKRFKRRVRLRR